jgi:hypothetical protein
MRIPGALKTALALLALAVVATAMLAGCGSSSDETGESGEPPASTSGAPGGQEAPIGSRAKVCTDSSVTDGEVRVTGVPCGLGRLLVAGWYKNSECSSPAGASRTSCKLGSFTCLALNAGRGLAVTCAGPSRSVVFIAKRAPARPPE